MLIEPPGNGLNSYVKLLRRLMVSAFTRTNNALEDKFAGTIKYQRTFVHLNRGDRAKKLIRYETLSDESTSTFNYIYCVSSLVV